MVTASKRWLEVCRTLGHDLSTMTSAGFQMRVSYERCLLDYELHVTGKAPRSTTSSDTAAANGNAAAGKKKHGKAAAGGASGPGSRSMGAGGVGVSVGVGARVAAGMVGGMGTAMTNRPTPSGRPHYKHSKKEEEDIARALGLPGRTCPEGILEDLSEDEAGFLFPGANEADYCNIRSSMLARWRFEPSLYLSVETACDWYNPRWGCWCGLNYSVDAS